MSLISKTFRNKILSISNNNKESRKDSLPEVKDKDNSELSIALKTLNNSNNSISLSCSKNTSSINTSSLYTSTKNKNNLINPQKFHYLPHNRNQNQIPLSPLSELPNLKYFSSSFNHSTSPFYINSSPPKNSLPSIDYSTPLTAYENKFKPKINLKSHDKQKKNHSHLERKVSLRYEDIKFDSDKKVINGNSKEAVKSAFNKLYGITENLNNNIKNVKNQKEEGSIEDYQNKIMNIASYNTSNTNFSNLVFNLKIIRNIAENTKPLPKINIQTIIEHVKNKKKNDRQVSLREFLERMNNPVDEYEKEEKLIQKMRSKKPVKKSKRNRNLSNLPPFLVKVFEKIK